MEYIELGGSGLVVSRIVFGCEPIGGTDWGTVSDQNSVQAVRTALDRGINFFDTADVYGLGHSEEILSEALGPRRKDLIIATKFGVNWTSNHKGGRARTFFDSSPAQVLKALEASLRRLRLDSIPLYQAHWPDAKTPIAETMEALIKCRDEGKIQHIGVSNFSSDQIRQAHQIFRLASAQMPYNLVDRAVEHEDLQSCRAFGVAAMGYGALAQGLLTDKYGLDMKFGANDRRSRLGHFQKEEMRKNLELVGRLRLVGSRCGKTPAQVAIRWVLDNPQIACTIVGIKTVKQLDENLGALDWKLGDEDRDFLSQ